MKLGRKEKAGPARQGQRAERLVVRTGRGRTRAGRRRRRRRTRAPPQPDQLRALRVPLGPPWSRQRGRRRPGPRHPGRIRQADRRDPGGDGRAQSAGADPLSGGSAAHARGRPPAAQSGAGRPRADPRGHRADSTWPCPSRSTTTASRSPSPISRRSASARSSPSRSTTRSDSSWRRSRTSSGPSTAATGPSAAWTAWWRPSSPWRAPGRRAAATDTAETEVVADDAPVVQVVTRILTQAKRDRASDVHIEPSQDVVRVRFRIDGALKEVLMLPAAMGVGLVSRIKIMAGMNIVERRRPQDGQLTTAGGRQGHRRPGLHGHHHLGREVRHADPRQEQVRAAAARPRHADRHARDVLAPRQGSLRDGAVRRPDGIAGRRPRCTPP